MRWGFATWMSDAPTGGNVYDRRLIAELLACGVDLREHRVDGTWPRVSAIERAGLADLLTREPRWLIDAIVACGAPDVVTAAINAGRPVVALVHSFMSDEVWSSTDELRAYEEAERTVLRAASGVICTSRWAADRVARLYGRTDASVARPGSDPTPIASGTGLAEPPHILALGTVCARKDQLSLVRALADVADLPWTARIVGAVEIEAEYAENVRAEATRLGLADCVSVVGPRTGDALEAEWDATDLLVLTSRAEAYGMVVVEALARGIPSIVTQGTGAEEAQMAGGTDVRPGAVVRPGDPDALAGVLNRWLTDHELRQQWRQAALGAKSRLPAWESTTRAVVDQLRTAV